MLSHKLLPRIYQPRVSKLVFTTKTCLSHLALADFVNFPIYQLSTNISIFFRTNVCIACLKAIIPVSSDRSLPFPHARPITSRCHFSARPKFTLSSAALRRRNGTDITVTVRGTVTIVEIDLTYDVKTLVQRGESDFE